MYIASLLVKIRVTLHRIDSANRPIWVQKEMRLFYDASKTIYDDKEKNC